MIMSHRFDAGGGSIGIAALTPDRPTANLRWPCRRTAVSPWCGPGCSRIGVCISVSSTRMVRRSRVRSASTPSTPPTAPSPTSPSVWTARSPWCGRAPSPGGPRSWDGPSAPTGPRPPTHSSSRTGAGCGSPPHPRWRRPERLLVGYSAETDINGAPRGTLIGARSPSAIFHDGFESGDHSSWSGSAP